MKKFISVASRNNSGFYITFLDEIVSFITSIDLKSNTTAFLHLYRLLEHISYAFPLLYISKAKDFKESYGYFKSYFEAQNGDKKNELSFFKSFIQIALKDDPIILTDITFNLTGEDEYKQKHYNLLTKNINQELMSSSCIQNEKFVIIWHSLPGLVINLRNRYFHFTNSNPSNISQTDIVDSELFFGNINLRIMEWLTTVFTVILNNLYQSII